MNHNELCMKTAERFNTHVSLVEYKSYAYSEEPDVLVFDYGRTTLYEIKVSRPDFIADKKKDCRKKYKTNYHFYIENPEVRPEIKRAYVRFSCFEPKLFYKQYPHLGNYRYFVCEKGLILPEEVPEGWGLYWYSNGKFYQKKRSEKFRSNMKAEKDLLMHALQRYSNNEGNEKSVMIKKY